MEIIMVLVARSKKITSASRFNFAFASKKEKNKLCHDAMMKTISPSNFSFRDNFCLSCVKKHGNKKESLKNSVKVGLTTNQRIYPIWFSDPDSYRLIFHQIRCIHYNQLARGDISR